MIITKWILRYAAWRRTRERERGHLVLCGYLGCGEYATRHAVDRHCNPILACPDTAHGRTVVS